MALEWIELPAGPLPTGDWARVAGRRSCRNGRSAWSRSASSRRPRPLERSPSSAGAARTGCRRSCASLRPRLAEGGLYDTGGRGDFPEKDGRFSLAFPLEDEGHYFVVCYLRRQRCGPGGHEPGTTALVTAGR